MNSLSRGVSQPVPNACVVVTLVRRWACPLNRRAGFALSQACSAHPARSCKAVRPAPSARARAHACETRERSVAFKRANMAADRGLADAQRFARVGKTPRLGGSVKNPQLVPIQGHGFCLRDCTRLFVRLRQCFKACQIAFGIQGRHAAHARGSDSLAVNVVGNVSSGENPRYVCSRRFRGGNDVPGGLISTCPLNIPVAGAWPMAMNTPSTLSSLIAPVPTSRSFTPCTPSDRRSPEPPPARHTTRPLSSGSRTAAPAKSSRSGKNPAGVSR